PRRPGPLIQIRGRTPGGAIRTESYRDSRRNPRRPRRRQAHDENSRRSRRFARLRAASHAWRELVHAKTQRTEVIHAKTQRRKERKENGIFNGVIQREI